MIFNEKDWYMLASLFNGVRHPDTGVIMPYAGYKPHVAEAPNGDTRVCDACGSGRRGVLPKGACPACNGTGRVPNVAPPTTRYLHVAPKYSPPAWATAYLARAHYEACRVAEALGVPAAYYPRVADGTLRVLDYDVGGSQPEHTDFDLFTIVCYRSTPEDLELIENRDHDRCGYSKGELAARAISPGLHIGEIGELVGLGPATPHRVPARPYRQQSIVYFAMPDHAAPLECDCPRVDLHGHRPYPYRSEPQRSCTGTTVGEWLDKRKAASRVYK